MTVGGQTSAVTPGDRFTYGSPCRVSSFTQDPAGTATIGQTVTLTATGCSSPQYQFWVYIPGSGAGTGWTLLHDYSTSSSYNWATTLKTAGSYAFVVNVRSGGTSVAYEDYGYVPSYTLSTTSPACQAGSFSQTPATTAPVGTAVQLSASATACSSPQYQFWAYTPGIGAGSGWQLLQDYGAGSTATWATAGQAASDGYYLLAFVRQQGSSAAYEDYAYTPYTLTANSCRAGLFLETPVGHAAVGQTVSLSARASGCTTPEYTFYAYIPGTGAGSGWQQIRAYGRSSTASWTTTGKAAGQGYYLLVLVREQGSTAAFDGYTYTPYSLTP